MLFGRLEEAAANFRQGLTSPTFTSFLSTPRFWLMMRQLRALRSLPRGIHIVKLGKDFITTLSGAAERFPQACCVADVTIAGVPIQYVNAACTHKGASNGSLCGVPARPLPRPGARVGE